MPVTISQQDYWDLIYQARCQQNLNRNDKFDVTHKYPEPLGQGKYREIRLRQGIILDIVRYHLHDRVIVQSPERSHIIECNFAIAGQFLHNHSTVAGQYELFGSGIASIERWERSPTEPAMGVGVHIEPELFQAFLEQDQFRVGYRLDHRFDDTWSVRHVLEFNEFDVEKIAKPIRRSTGEN